MDIMEVFKPNMYITLCISDTDLDSSTSVIEKSVNISNRLFKSCLERHHGSNVNMYILFSNSYLIFSENFIKQLIFIKH